MNTQYLPNEPVNVILLNFNGSADTIECLNSIMFTDYNNIEITIVDNNSSIYDFNILRQYIYKNYRNLHEYEFTDLNFNLTNKLVFSNLQTRINLIRLNQNLGFANANNLGIDFGKKRFLNFYFILNNDTIILKDTISGLMKFITENPSYHALIPQIRYYDNRNVIWNCGGYIKFYGKCDYLFPNKCIDNTQFKKIYEIDFVTGCALLINYKKTGKFSDKYFFGEEDFDFSIKQKRNNMKMACFTNSVVYHKVNSTINKSNSNNISRFYYYYLCRLLNFKLNYNGMYKYFLYSMVVIKILQDSLLIHNLNIVRSLKNLQFIFKTLNQNKQIDENIFKVYLINHKWK
jgi:GT2 family glycosyltransferase